MRTELVELGMHSPTGDRGGVWFDGTFEDGMRACLHARVAVRVMVHIGSFEVRGPDDLYEGGRSIEWQNWIDLARTFAVRANLRDSAVTHSGYAALKLKDAIVDTLRERLGARPNVDPHDPDVGVQLHLRGSQARVFLDLAGEPLHRRGYRVAMTDAPLKETLAAAILRIGRISPDLPFVDPMAGSGTLAIEQALLARHMAPGLGRHFGFERWPLFDEALQRRWADEKERARAQILPRCPAPIVCADVLSSALDAARANAARAGVAQDLDYQLADVHRGIDRRWPRATLCSNPPYGERLLGESDRMGRRQRDAEERAAPSASSARAGAGAGAGAGGAGAAGAGAAGARREQPMRAEHVHERASNGPPGPKAVLRRPASKPRDAAHERRSGRSGADLVELYQALATAVRRLSGWRAVLLCGNPDLAGAIRLQPTISHRLFNGDLEVRLLCYDIIGR